MNPYLCTFSARPGYSEHQTGLATDIDNGGRTYILFKDTQEYQWMQENAHKYGFIQRYQEGKESITGYNVESWHYRYVGTETAEFIKSKNITYDEYYETFIKSNK